ncbi:MAG: hypothetical protein N2319_01470 [Candidatus Kapabacteria bacterium]|nr:hypothetical protein [Candidatus Kapabacteria bacterium]
MTFPLNLLSSTKDHPPDQPCETQCCSKHKKGSQIVVYYHCRLAFIKYNFIIYALCFNGEFYQEYTCVKGFFTRSDVCCYFHDYKGSTGCPYSTEGETEAEVHSSIDKESECLRNNVPPDCSGYSIVFSTEIFPK